MDYRQEIEAFARDNFAEAVELLKTLGKIPAPSHHEEQRAAFIRQWFIDEGADDVRIDEVNNVICRIAPAGCTAYAAFAAHTDVVFDDTEPLPMREEGDRLFAPGIGDDTANLVNLMMGCRFLLRHRDRLRRGVLIVANSCEEGMGNLAGVRALFDTYGLQITEFYSFDCDLPECVSVPVGSHRYRVSVTAEGGHSYSDFGSANAIQQAAELVGALYRIEPPAPGTTFNVGVIEGGTTVNSIAEHCSFLYEFRSTSAACLEEMQAKMDAVLEGARERGVQVEVETIGVRPGAEGIDEDALRAWTDRNIEVIERWYPGRAAERPGSTDANLPLSRGILANTIGTVTGGGAHTRGEWVDVTSLACGVSIVCDLIARYLEE